MQNEGESRFTTWKVNHETDVIKTAKCRARKLK